MTRELKQRWLEALRSGKFPKGKYYLKDTRGDRPVYCCLGVLCEVIGAPTTAEGEDGSKVISSLYDPIKALLSHKQVTDLTCQNDRTDSFDESVIPYIEHNIVEED